MKTLIVDSNNLSFRIFSTFKESRGGPLKTSFGVPTSVIFGIINSLNMFTSIGSNGQVDRTIMCWDLGGGSKFRKGIFKLYKKNRSYKDMTDYFEELDSARKHLSTFGIMQAPCQGIEADDVLGWFATKELEAGNEVVIFSDDKDYFRLLGPGKKLKLFRPCVNEFYTYRQFKNDHNYKPKYMTLIDALTGQEKDNIPGACDLEEQKDGTWKMKKYGFGEAKAVALLEASGWSLKTLHEMLKANTVKCNEAHRSQLLKNWKNVKISKLLSRIRCNDDEYSEEELKLLRDARENCKVSKIKLSKAMRLAGELEFNSLKAKLPSILKKIGVEYVKSV